MAISGAERVRRYHERRMAEIAAMPPIPCGCGCGELIPPINKKLKPATYKHGHQPGGEATRFKTGHRETPAVLEKRIKRGAMHWRWRGGEYMDRNGYVRVVVSRDEGLRYPTARLGRVNSWTIMRSHLVWNRAHPDDLVQRGDQVHHKNRRPGDDNLENLAKMSRAEHSRLHAPDKALRARDSKTGRFI